MIKKIITLISAILLSFASNAQELEKFWAEFKQLYNQNKFAEMYKMLSPSFQKEMSVEEHVSFFKDGLKAEIGNMQSAALINHESEVYNYVITFDNEKLDVMLMIDKDQKVLGWLWQAHAPANTQDLSNIKYVNPLANNLDSIIHEQAKNYLKNHSNAQISFALVTGKDIKYYYYSLNNALPDSKSIYEIGSITKTYIGWLIAQAIEDGKIKLDDDIRKYLPDGKYPNLVYKDKTIQIKHLLNHSSGLNRLPDNLNQQKPNNYNDPYANYDNKMLIAYLKKAKPKQAPGNVSEYSNLGYGLLGFILEQVYGQKLEDILNQQLKTQLALAPVRFDAENALLGYDNWGKASSAWHFKSLAGAGAIKTDVDQLSHFLQAYINMKSNAIKNSVQIIDTALFPPMGFAWVNQNLPNDTDKVIWHNGGTGGFCSFYGFLQNQQVGIVVLSNVSAIVDELGFNILQSIQLQK